MSDNPKLSPARRYRETPDVVNGVARMLRALANRLQQEDPSDLQHLVALQAELDVMWQTAVAGLRRSGFSDTDIGRELGVTKQAVQKRWPR